MTLTDSNLRYLLAIHHLAQQSTEVSPLALAQAMGVTKPSVTYTTKRLRESGYITMDKDGLITLTDSGLAIAESMLERHRLLSGFLMALGVEEAVALRDACRIEHDISQQTFEAICRHVQSEKKQPR